PPLPAQHPRRDERLDPARDRTQGPWLGRTRQPGPPAPCYPRLPPRRPLSRPAVGAAKQRGRRPARRRLPAMKTRIALLCAALLFAASALAQQVQPLERIAAVVDEDVILQSELDRAVANILAQYADRRHQLPPRQVLERLILMKLQTARAAETGVRVGDAEVDAAISAIAQQNNLSPDQLRQQLAREGMSIEDFRASLRDEILIQRLRQRFAQSRIS